MTRGLNNGVSNDSWSILDTYYITLPFESSYDGWNLDYYIYLTAKKYKQIINITFFMAFLFLLASPLSIKLTCINLVLHPESHDERTQTCVIFHLDPVYEPLVQSWPPSMHHDHHRNHRHQVYQLDWASFTHTWPSE